jgi:hypothetical protein
MHLPRFEQAEEDCNAALSFDLAPPDKAKALLRRGTARVHLYRGPDALQDFQAVLRLEPNNRQAKEEVQVSGCGCVCVGGGGGGAAVHPCHQQPNRQALGRLSVWSNSW